MQALAKNADSGAQGAWGMPARAANACLSKANRERSGVLSTAQRHTAFLDDPRIVRALSASDIDLDGLKNRPTSVYIVLPPDKLAAYGRVARACIGLAVKAPMRVPGKPRHDVLFLLDEFAQLGRFDAVEDSLAILRGYGGVFWLLVRDLSQLRAVYPRAETFLANTVLQAFGTQDYQTARYLSQMLGSETIRVESHGISENKSWEQQSHGTSHNRSSRGREILTPDEIRRLSTRQVLVFEQGQPPYMLQRLDYRADAECRGLADVNPMHESVRRTG